MRGGPHDGFTIDPSRSPAPRALCKISFVDGSGVGRQERDPSGTRREVFEFDVDGSLLAAAEKRFVRAA
jgi:hypothetical protein